MNSFLASIKEHSNNVFWEDSHTKVHYHQLEDTILQLAEHVSLPERTLVAVQEAHPLDVLKQVLALWKKNCIPVLIPSDTPADMMSDLETQVPFGEECPEGDLVFFTSGTQGKPKGIVHSIQTLFNSANATIQHYGLVEGNKWGLTLPVHHTGGFMILLRCIAVGATVVHGNSWRDVLHTPCDFYSLVPTQLQESIHNENLIKAKVVLIGGAALSQDILNAANEEGIPIYLSYGMTETAAQITSSMINPTISNLAGHPLPGSEVDLDQEGHIKLKSNGLMIGQFTHGIFHSPELIDDWFVQKDFGEMTNDGLIVKGRSDRIFISGGENINPTTIEKAFFELPYVNSIYVEAVDDERFGKVPIALIEAQRDELEKIEEEAGYRLPKFMHPKEYIPFKWDYERGLKPDKRFRKLLIDLYQMKKKVHFNYEVEGTLGKPVVIMLHGFMGDTSDWKTIVDKISDQCFMILIDLPGHGKTQSNSYTDQQQFLDELQMFSSQFKNHTPTGVGYSMGGRLLLQLENQTPGLFKSLLLESVHPGIQDDSERIERLKKDETLLDGLFTTAKFRDFLDSWYDLPLFQGIKDNKNYENMVRHKLQATPSELQQGLNLLSTGHQTDCREVFKTGKTPITYIAGGRDSKYAEFAKEIASYGNSMVEVGISAGNCHNIHFESPDMFCMYLKAALK